MKEKTPNLLEYTERLENLPGIKDLLAKREPLKDMSEMLAHVN